jgi:hypothetical protein
MNLKVKALLQHLVITFFIFLVFSSCDRKDYTPCTDPNAFNYNPRATVDDGSCTYASYIIEPEFITDLVHGLRETSGLAFWNGHLWTHNDKGDENELYSIDKTTGGIKHTIVLDGADNVDYEDLAQNEDYIFVGDVGNNEGDRKDLVIYRIAKEGVEITGSQTSVRPDKIRFDYEDQQDFSTNRDHNFDCEAIIYLNDKIYLFTKNRADNQSNLYAMPAQPGYHKAKRISSFYTGGRITGACINSKGNQVILIGYNKRAHVFLWVLDNFADENFFSSTKRYVNLGPFDVIGQAEAITYFDDETIYISAEQIEGQPAKLYKMSLEKIK